MIGALKLGVPVFMIGAAAGWLSLMFVGVPLVAPSYMAQREALTKAQGAAASQATARAQENSDRTEERDDANEDVSGERLSCDARIADLTALWSVSARPADRSTPNEASPNESCSCAEYGDIRPLDDWLSDAGLLDDG